MSKLFFKHCKHTTYYYFDKKKEYYYALVMNESRNVLIALHHTIDNLINQVIFT